MKTDILMKLAARLFFVFASLTIAAAFLEWGAQQIGYSLTGGSYTAGRLLELSAILLVYVIAIRLRQILMELRLQGGRRT
ncbi:MAG: hypothetical protein OEW73_13245 [Gammaproteobacteria bacterium]|nr:hypothetical protein [Gammaproteobacteria bacterium]MDH5241738.1 hypothetical protein [Gammaproteobacteria bacterium]MDH5309915.1 hypothetical protein [Gammaproteobacteria bacterium]